MRKKKRKKKRQMREKLLQMNEAVGGETREVRMTTLHSVTCFPGRLWDPTVPGIQQGTRGGGNRNSDNPHVAMVMITGHHVYWAFTQSSASILSQCWVANPSSLFSGRLPSGGGGGSGEWGQLTAENPRRTLVLKDSWENPQLRNFLQILKCGALIDVRSLSSINLRD